MEMKYFDLIKPGTTHDFVKYRRIAVVVSLIVNALVLVGVIVWPGLNYGVDFAGGTELQVHFKKQVEPGEIRDLVGHQGFGEPTVQRYGNESENQFLVRVERIAKRAFAGIGAASHEDLLHEAYAKLLGGERVWHRGYTAVPAAVTAAADELRAAGKRAVSWAVVAEHCLR